MEGVYAIVYCDGDMISSSEKILFECPSVSKVVIISEDMLFDVLKKTIIDAKVVYFYLNILSINQSMLVMTVLNTSVL